MLLQNLFELEDEYYFYSNNYIKYESNGHRDKSLSIEEYFKKIKPYLKDTLINLQKSGT